MLEEYPAFLNSWECQKKDEFAEIAKDNSEGERDIETTIYHSLSSVFDEDASKKNIFYQSVFIMCFSYYESCITLLSKKVHAKGSVDSICKAKKIHLSEESSNASGYLKNYMRILRNNICHNNFGTYHNEDTLEEIAKQYSGFDFDSKTIYITDSYVVTDALNKMHHVLRELCEKLDYNTRFLTKSKTL